MLFMFGIQVKGIVFEILKFRNREYMDFVMGKRHFYNFGVIILESLVL